jgi:hypothetical protein
MRGAGREAKVDLAGFIQANDGEQQGGLESAKTEFAPLVPERAAAVNHQGRRPNPDWGSGSV